MNKSRLSALLLLSILISGCNTAAQTPSDLLRAPSQGNADGTITGIVKPFLPANAHLTVPIHSQSGSAIQLQDLDKDGKEEILAFYKTDKTDYEINALVLSQKDGDWKKLTTITGVGRELDSVEFTDVTGDGANDLLLGFSGGEDLSKELAVYSLNDGKLTELLKQPYNQLVVGDITHAGKNEVALFQGNIVTDNQSSSNIVLYQFNNTGAEPLSSQNISGTVIQVLFGKASPSSTGLFVDAAIGAHSSYTALLTWENGRFADILNSTDYQHKQLADSKDLVLKSGKMAKDAVIGENNLAVKDYPLYSTDINNDGIIEIGFLVPPAGSESSAPLATPFISKYYQWDGQAKLSFVEERFDRWGFNFHIPQSWRGKYTLNTPQDSPLPWENIQFSYKNADTGKPAPLLSLRLISKKDWSAAEAKLRAEQASYKVLYELPDADGGTTPTVVVAVMPAAKDPAGLSGAALQEYQGLQLTLEEVQQLAGTPVNTRE